MSFTSGYGDRGRISGAAGALARISIAASDRVAGARRSERGGALARYSAKPRLAGGSISHAATDVRFEKVLALRAAIAAGTYAVSAANLAEKLMATMQVPYGFVAR
jgi:hypothetical protein